VWGEGGHDQQTKVSSWHVAGPRRAPCAYECMVVQQLSDKEIFNFPDERVTHLLALSRMRMVTKVEEEGAPSGRGVIFLRPQGGAQRQVGAWLARGQPPGALL
jgi:hypothetical protein